MTGHRKAARGMSLRNTWEAGVEEKWGLRWEKGTCSHTRAHTRTHLAHSHLDRKSFSFPQLVVFECQRWEQAVWKRGDSYCTCGHGQGGWGALFPEFVFSVRAKMFFAGLSLRSKWANAFSLLTCLTQHHCRRRAISLTACLQHGAHDWLSLIERYNMLCGHTYIRKVYIQLCTESMQK